jgi:large subunit ribosomal protein L30
MPEAKSKAKGKAKEVVKVIKVTLVRSPIGYEASQKLTVKALGLHRIRQTVEHKDSAALRGMIDKVRHLVHVEE